ncbi:MAG: hypothetical protein JXX14_12680 [Deltaproteobacteria bacterium]|nr:hypothetical protein [Deltaproteobacteria bacterium]
MIVFSYRVFLVVLLSAFALGCNTPLQSQKYFAQAVKNDPVMEPLHQTALYTVYFDHALQRCVLHSSYTWGESGGGTGGTGLGVSVFNCNPQALKAHADRLREQIKNGTDYFELPVPKVRQTKPTSQQSTSGLTQPGPRLSTAPATVSKPSTPPMMSPSVQVQTAPPASQSVQGAAASPPASSSGKGLAPQGKSTTSPPPEEQPSPGNQQNGGPKLLQPITMP